MDMLLQTIFELSHPNLPAACAQQLPLAHLHLYLSHAFALLYSPEFPFSVPQLSTGLHLLAGKDKLNWLRAVSTKFSERIAVYIQIILLQKLPQEATMSENPTPSPEAPQPSSSEVIYEKTPITSPRSLSQMSIFFLGASLFMVSASVTSRAVYRRQIRAIPRFFVPNTNPHEYFSPWLDAVQALGIATMNVTSVGVMVVGGTLWAFDISTMTEMRAILRGRLGYEAFDDESKKLLGYEGPLQPVGKSELEAQIIKKRKEEEESKTTDSKRQ